MNSRAEFAIVIDILEAYFGKKMTREQMTIYYELLKDIDADLVMISVRKILSERVYSSIPMAAEIRREAAALKMGHIESAVEAFSIFLDCARRYGHDRFQDALAAMPVSVRSFFDAQGVRYWQWACMADMSDYNQARLMKSYEQHTERRISECIALPEVKEAQGRLAENARQVNGIVKRIASNIGVRTAEEAKDE